VAPYPQDDKLPQMGPQLLLTTLLTLSALLAILYVGGRWLSARGLGLTRRGKHVEVVERVPLDFKSALYVVRASGRTWLLSGSDGSAPRLLFELPSPEPESKDMAGAAEDGQSTRRAHS